MAQRLELDCRKPSGAEREEDKATQLMFPSWCACCVEGKVSRQLDRCCSSDRDVPEMQLDCFSHELQEIRPHEQ